MACPGLGRFRANIFQQRGTVSIVLRVIPDHNKSVAQLGLPPVIDKIAEERRGLILVTGATGSGKSTTLAAMIDCINSTRSGHIVTIEDPIEFLHRDKHAFVTQREVDVDTRSFAEALRGALRQDPDVILVGEMRDHETIETALTAAETGHLVLSTLHTLDATETITRIVSSFPSHQQKSVRLQLAGILKAVISMRLVRAAKGAGRVPAIEVLVSTATIRDHIINEEKTYMIREAIAAGTSQYGMQTFDQSLFQLLQQRLITHGRSTAQRQQSRRVQDARPGNLLGRRHTRSHHDAFRVATARSESRATRTHHRAREHLRKALRFTRMRRITRTPARQSSLISKR